MPTFLTDAWHAVEAKITSGTVTGYAIIVLAITVIFGATSIVTNYLDDPQPLPERPFYLVSPAPSVHAPYLMEVPPIVEPVPKSKKGRRS